MTALIELHGGSLQHTLEWLAELEGEEKTFKTLQAINTLKHDQKRQIFDQKVDVSHVKVRSACVHLQYHIIYHSEIYPKQIKTPPKSPKSPKKTYTVPHWQVRCRGGGAADA